MLRLITFSDLGSYPCPGTCNTMPSLALFPIVSEGILDEHQDISWCDIPVLTSHTINRTNTKYYTCSFVMVVGGCFCGNIRVEYNGEPIISALCHCYDCRKLTGTLFTYSFVVHKADLKITGNPKEVAKRADSGNHIKNYFCSDCGG
ncbi:Glutathione-dependent formaldehyde-activating enzyme [Aspergillus parasiticus SU-1]|uniref:Glutathione-dependent formaldehyde-activating enzyme n=1 Tax=Aspergillus parasiticus (strain ATCC 56775 / NRRL 5862 / SRRC 143 / SU-1) TaxID=1403190 RepID=A0A0F0IPS1_ASPPU|nr:Glutathione-dependent formaldehyde-activating enzyme [Aspergillus parasiticus SU-1]